MSIDNASDFSPLLFSETSEIEDTDELKTRPDQPSTVSLSLLSFVFGLVQTLPLAILIPVSLATGLSTIQASLIISAWPVSSLLSLFLQPSFNRMGKVPYLCLTGTTCSLSFCSFYLSVHWDRYSFLFAAIAARFLSGTALFLINNKVAVGLTDHLRGNVERASALYEVFNSAGQAAGAFVGSVVYAAMGFDRTMLVAGGITAISVVLLGCILPGSGPATSGDEVLAKREVLSSRSFYRLHVTKHMLMYCWCPMLCIGACMVFVEGILTQFYLTTYSKSLGFGGILLGESGVLYSVSAIVIGSLRAIFPILTDVGLVSGLLIGGLSLLFIGPYLPIPAIPDLYTSIGGFNLLLVSSCAIQLNSITVSARSLNKHTSTLANGQAISVTMNAANVAYNCGAFVGPVLGGWLLGLVQYAEVFALGAAPMVLVGVGVGCTMLLNGNSG